MTLVNCYQLFVRIFRHRDNNKRFTRFRRLILADRLHLFYFYQGKHMISITLNGREQSFDVEGDMPLLWLIREEAGLRGTKFGCGIAKCGACTVHIDGQAVRSCVYPAIAAQGKQINTVETLGSKEIPHALQTAWLKHQVPQCGYCQSGMMMAAAALLKNTPNPSNDDIDAAMTNICRCGTYSRVKAAILDAAKEMSS